MWRAPVHYVVHDVVTTGTLRGALRCALCMQFPLPHSMSFTAYTASASQSPQIVSVSTQLEPCCPRKHTPIPNRGGWRTYWSAVDLYSGRRWRAASVLSAYRVCCRRILDASLGRDMPL